MTWMEEKEKYLYEKGRENWDQDDWEAYHYIENYYGEIEYYDGCDY